MFNIEKDGNVWIEVENVSNTLIAHKLPKMNYPSLNIYTEDDEEVSVKLSEEDLIVLEDQIKKYKERYGLEGDAEKIYNKRFKDEKTRDN